MMDLGDCKVGQVIIGLTGARYIVREVWPAYILVDVLDYTQCYRPIARYRIQNFRLMDFRPEIQEGGI